MVDHKKTLIKQCQLPSEGFAAKVFDSKKKGQPAKLTFLKFGVFCVRAGLDRSDCNFPHSFPPCQYLNTQHSTIPDNSSARCAVSVRVPVCQIISNTPIRDRHNDNTEPLQGLLVRWRQGERKQRSSGGTCQALPLRVTDDKQRADNIHIVQEQIRTVPGNRKTGRQGQCP